MQRVVSFYEKLPRGAAPAVKPKGLLGRYQARYFGKNPSGARTFCPYTKQERTGVLIKGQLSFMLLCSWLALVMLRTTTSIFVSLDAGVYRDEANICRPPQEQCSLDGHGSVLEQ
jgi:hypothetical protein